MSVIPVWNAALSVGTAVIFSALIIIIFRSVWILVKFVLSVGNIQTGLPSTGRWPLIALRSVKIDCGSDDAIVLSNNPTDISSG